MPDDRAQRQARVVERLRERIRAGEVRPFDGMVWLAHLDAAGTPRLFSRVSDPVADLDELYLLDLLTTLEAIGLPGVTVAIWRADGVPVAVDRRLARDLTNRLTPDGVTKLDAVMVVNAHGCRPVRASRPERPATRRDRRPSRSNATGRDK